MGEKATATGPRSECCPVIVAEKPRKGKPKPILQFSSWKERPDFTLNEDNEGKGVAMGGGGTLISIYPEDLTFLFELDKPCYCNLKVVNNSEHHVAFKVKTTSPRKYFVRPNANIVQPWDSCTITITLQVQKEYPPDMQCKDKFLIQSTRVAASTDMDEIPPDTFNKEVDKVIEEIKLKVVYTVPSGSSDDSGITSLGSRSFKSLSDDFTMLKNASIEEIQTIQRLKDERDNMLQQNQQMQRELDVIRRRRSRKSDTGFSLTFAAFVGLIGLLVGLLMSLIFSSPQPAA
uniref:MSP domain-containing protein n=1 Tax=Oryza glumipatula TaxID=40148 RepID=A0A0D9YVS0_9ORYZ